IGRGRASVQGVEERSVDPSHLSPARNPNRSPYFHCVSGLLSAGHAETAAEDAGAGIDGEGRARKTRRHADDRCRTAHDGRSGGRLVPLYGAREGSVAPASTVEAPTSRPAPTENHCPEQPRRRVSAHSLWCRPLEVRSKDFSSLASPTSSVGEVGLEPETGSPATASSASYYVLDIAYIIVFLGSLFCREFAGFTGLVSKAIRGRDGFTRDFGCGRYE